MADDLAVLKVVVDNSQMDSGTASMNAMTAAAQSLQSSVNAMQQSYQNMQQQMQQTVTQTQALNAAQQNQVTLTRQLTEAVMGLFAIYGAAKIIELADSYNQLEARIRIITQTTGDFAATNQKLWDIAVSTGTSMQTLTGQYQRLSVTAKDIGASNADILKLVEEIQMLGAISGTSAQQMGMSTNALTRMFESGIIKGQQLNLLLRSSPAIFQAIADGAGKTGIELKNMAAQGQLTGAMVFRYLLADFKKVKEEFASLPGSVQRSLGGLANAFQELVGAINQSSGATQILSGAIQALSGFIVFLSTHVDDTIAVIIALGAALAVLNFEAIGAAIMTTLAPALDLATAAVIRLIAGFVSLAGGEVLSGLFALATPFGAIETAMLAVVATIALVTGGFILLQNQIKNTTKVNVTLWDTAQAYVHVFIENLENIIPGMKEFDDWVINVATHWDQVAASLAVVIDRMGELLNMNLHVESDLQRVTQHAVDNAKDRMESQLNQIGQERHYSPEKMDAIRAQLQQKALAAHYQTGADVNQGYTLGLQNYLGGLSNTPISTASSPPIDAWQKPKKPKKDPAAHSEEEADKIMENYQISQQLLSVETQSDKQYQLQKDHLEAIAKVKNLHLKLSAQEIEMLTGVVEKTKINDDLIKQLAKDQAELNKLKKEDLATQAEIANINKQEGGMQNALDPSKATILNQGNMKLADIQAPFKQAITEAQQKLNEAEKEGLYNAGEIKSANEDILRIKAQLATATQKEYDDEQKQLELSVDKKGGFAEQLQDLQKQNSAIGNPEMQHMLAVQKLTADIASQYSTSNTNKGMDPTDIQKVAENIAQQIENQKIANAAKDEEVGLDQKILDLNRQSAALAQGYTYNQTTQQFELKGLQDENDLIAAQNELKQKGIAVSDKYYASLLAEALQQENSAKALKDTQTQMQILQQFSQSVGSTFSNSFEQMIFGAKSFQQTLASVFQELSKLVYEEFVGKQLSAWVTTQSNSLLNLLGIGSNGVAAMNATQVANGGIAIRSAHGNVFDQGGFHAFAQGGVVDSPTIFPFADGTGLMGEAGPEAIVPLTRMANGDLGISAGGIGGDGDTQVNNQVNVNVQGAASSSPQDNQIMAKQMAKEMQRTMDARIDNRIRIQQRNGNLLSTSNQLS